MHILCLGLSHQTAPVELREKFAIPDGQLGSTALQLSKVEGVAEAVIVSTCNRVELYVAAQDHRSGVQAVQQFLTRILAGTLGGTLEGTLGGTLSGALVETSGSALGGSSGSGLLKRSLVELPTDAFFELPTGQSQRHLFRVVSGLESMVLGETEILGQVKKAYQAAQEGGATGRHLNKLFQRAFNVAKEVRSKTNITRGSVSVGSVAVELAEKIFGKLAHCRVMILGAGEMSELTAGALKARGVETIFVANRSYERAALLAETMKGKAIHFDRWQEEFADVDILIGSTAAPHHVLTANQLAPIMRTRPDRPLFCIDLAVPRDIEPAVNDLDGVYLYDIDSLQAIAARSMSIRRQDLSLCEAMIERHVNEFGQWLQAGIPQAGIDYPAGTRSPKGANP